MNEVISPPADRERELRQQFVEQLRRRLRTKRLFLLLAAFVFIAASLPLAIAALTAGLAFAATAILAFLGIICWKMLPRWILAIENREREKTQIELNHNLAALKAEARKNPIEQAENEYLSRAEQYEAFKAAMEQIGGRVRAFGSKLARTKKEKPGYDLSAETEALARMEQFYASRMERLSLAVVKLGQFRDKIEEARAKWDFQLDANVAIRAMNATDRDARINEILTEVAFDSVHQEFDAVFARLDVDAAEIRGAKALEFGRGASIDLLGRGGEHPDPSGTAPNA